VVRVAVGIGVGAFALVVLVAAGAAAMVTAALGPTDPAGGCAVPAAGAFAGSRLEDLTGEQNRNAEVIVAIGQRRAVPPRGWVIAVARPAGVEPDQPR
jgi:hypothetical protein